MEWVKSPHLPGEGGVPQLSPWISTQRNNLWGVQDGNLWAKITHSTTSSWQAESDCLPRAQLLAKQAELKLPELPNGEKGQLLTQPPWTPLRGLLAKQIESDRPLLKEPVVKQSEWRSPKSAQLGVVRLTAIQPSKSILRRGRKQEKASV
jgi:hypothetical protein